MSFPSSGLKSKAKQETSMKQAASITLAVIIPYHKIALTSFLGNLMTLFQLHTLCDVETHKSVRNVEVNSSDLFLGIIPLLCQGCETYLLT
jgi:hypothetical protein